MRMIAVLILCLALTGMAGCVRAKPPRERPPLPTLPVEATTEAPLESQALALPEGSSSETPTESAITGEETVLPLGATPGASETQEPTEAPTATPMPTATPEPTATPTPEPTPTPYTGPVYIVAPGDTLASIAKMHGSTVEAFLEANGLSGGEILAVGQALRLPPGVEPLYETKVENTTVHTVRYGETLTQIAAQYCMLPSQVLALNPQLKDPSLLRPGTEITVVVKPIPPDAVTHTVRPGETLSSIASLYGVSVYELAQANCLTDASRLSIGQVLVIPHAASMGD